MDVTYNMSVQTCYPLRLNLMIVCGVGVVLLWLKPLIFDFLLYLKK